MRSGIVAVFFTFVVVLPTSARDVRSHPKHVPMTKCAPPHLQAIEGPDRSPDRATATSTTGTAPANTATATTTTGTAAASQTATTTDTTAATAVPRPRVATPKPGELWEVEIAAPYADTAPKLALRHDNIEPPPKLAVATDVKLNPTLGRLHTGDVVRLRVDKATVTDIEAVTIGVGARSLGILAGVVALLLLVYVFYHHRDFRALLIGKDGPYSKSKTQMAIWFSILVIAYVAACVLRLYAGGPALIGGVGIPPHLALLAGISAFTFAAAKGIRVQQEEKRTTVGLVARNAAKSQGFFTDMTLNADNQLDLGDLQMIVITAMAVVVYVVQVWGWLGTLPVTALTTLPDVDTTVLATFGLGQGAYLLKKQVSGT